MIDRDEKTMSRFMANVEPEPMSGCWLWGASASDTGYGQITIKGRNYSSHRASYQLHVGEIPPGMLVCHKCDNPICVNPDHLFLGTPKDNMIDMVKKKRHLNPKTAGELHGSARLKAADIVEIRGAQGVSQSVLARKYNIAPSHVSAIRSGKRWAILRMEGSDVA